MCWRFGFDYSQKLRRSSVIVQSTMKSGHVYCVRKKAIRSFNIDFTCTHGGGNDCKRHVKSILLLSLNAHNHVDDYSGTLGGVCKVHISALVTSPKNWVVALSFSPKQNKKELVDWSVGRTWHKSANSRCLYRINGEWVPVPDGKKEPPRHCVLVVMRLSCWLWVRRWRGVEGLVW